MQIFEPARIGPVELPNRLLRSATFEGMCDDAGCPTKRYLGHYRSLSTKGLGALITGFTYTELGGRSMQPGQAGMDKDSNIAPFAEVVRGVHGNGGRIFLQLAHAGRQTTPAAAGGEVVAPSAKKSWYFGHRPHRLGPEQVHGISQRFAKAAWRAREAGFDGVQLHAAHGYLIHQFIHPGVNDRVDNYAVDNRSGIGTAFLKEVILEIRNLCTTDFPILIKISAGDDCQPTFRPDQYVALIRFLDSMRVAAVEVSCGTMDEALNIFRGESVPVDAVLDFNPRFASHNPVWRFISKKLLLPAVSRRFIPFAPMYNLPAACLAKQHTRVPVISVGGFRSGQHIRTAIEACSIDFVSLCRPIISEPDFALRLREDPNYESRCMNCNRCAIMCDSGKPTHCYGRRPRRSVNFSAPSNAHLSIPSLVTGVCL